MCEYSWCARIAGVCVPLVCVFMFLLCIWNPQPVGGVAISVVWVQSEQPPGWLMSSSPLPGQAASLKAESPLAFTRGLALP